MTYTDRNASDARRQIRKLLRYGQERVIAGLSLFADDPRPPASKKLTGRDAWRGRKENWRIIYEIHETELLVMVVTMVVVAGNRRDIYRR